MKAVAGKLAVGRPLAKEEGLVPNHRLKARVFEMGYKIHVLAQKTLDNGKYVNPSVLSGLMTGRINPYQSEKRILAKVLRCAQQDLFND